MRRPIKGRFVNINERPVSTSSPPRDPGDPHSRLLDEVPRAMYKGEIYEIFVTDDSDPKPGGALSRFSLVGHFEVEQASFVRVGDDVIVGGKELGPIVGYNACPALRAPESVVIHMYVKGERLVNGKDLGLTLDDEVTTRPREPA